MPFRHTHFLKPEFFPVPCQFGISAILVFRNHQGGSRGSVILKQLQVRAARTKGRRRCVSPFLHSVWSWSQTEGHIWWVGWLQHTSPDDWKVLESTPAFCWSCWPSLEASPADRVAAWCCVPAPAPALHGGWCPVGFALTINNGIVQVPSQYR